MLFLFCFVVLISLLLMINFALYWSIFTYSCENGGGGF